MDILVFDENLRPERVLDSAVSLTASECFDGPGACTVRFPLSAAAALIPDRILRIPGTEEMYRISSVRCESGAGEAEVRGEGMLGFFSRRAVPEFADRIGNAEDVLCSLALDVGAAALPGTVTAERAGVSAGVETKAGKSDLLGTMRQICGEAGVGMRLEFQPDDGSFRFSVREKKNTGVFLSRSLGNLVRAVRTEDDAGYKNRAVVLGSGGITVTADAAGLFDDGTDDVNMPVRELFYDASDVARSHYASDDAYREMLLYIARLQLKKHRPQRTLSVETDESTAASLSPGEICFFRDEELGISGEALCTERTLHLSPEGIRHTVLLRVQSYREG